MIDRHGTIRSQWRLGDNLFKNWSNGRSKSGNGLARSAHQQPEFPNSASRMHRPTFIVDNNVGKLATWLRALGYDTMFVNPIEDEELVEIALRENRIILTKDSGIMRRRVVTSGQIAALHIDHTDWREQLSQVIHTFHLRNHAPFTRCVKCNSLLESCPREKAAAEVPAFVLRTQEEFFSCPGCQRTYWRGSHWQRMQRAMNNIANPIT